jgi:hypothetical protein
MKGEGMKSLFMVFLGIAACACFPCDAKSLCVKEKTNTKIYVNPQIVKVTKEGIFLSIHGQLFPVSSVATDSKGVFVTSSVTKWRVKCAWCKKYSNISAEDIDDNGRWKCPKCGAMN